MDKRIESKRECMARHGGSVATLVKRGEECFLIYPFRKEDHVRGIKLSNKDRETGPMPLESSFQTRILKMDATVESVLPHSSKGELLTGLSLGSSL